MGAVLDTLGVLADDPATHERWRASVQDMCRALGWPDRPAVVRPHASGAMLAIEAPLDQLMTATEVNEWAWELATGLIGGDAAAYAGFEPLHASVAGFGDALALFRERAAAERRPALTSLLNAAREHALPLYMDDDNLSLGAGSGCMSWPLAALPAVKDVPWASLHDVPTALVSGSNGKTTTVRLLAAFARAAGLTAGYCCTDGVSVGDTMSATGDYSGPGGARTVLRDRAVEFAVLETARGGILRRGLTPMEAEVAVITNVSADHFGEYGIDCVEDLADTKLVLAHALGTAGVLVLNADDPVLMARALNLRCRVALSALDYLHPRLVQARAEGGASCGVSGGRLLLHWAGVEHDLGAVVGMPLTVGGGARYNIANIAGAALAGAALGFAPTLLAEVLTRFGSTRLDNPGRMERWDLNGMTVLMDYAHNPEGLAGLLAVANGLRGAGRLGLLMGQAGNRGDGLIHQLAQAAAAARPDHVVLRDISGYLRGRSEGEVPAILRRAMVACGTDDSIIETVLPEFRASCTLLEWGRAGDVVVLPMHSLKSRQKLQQLLDSMQVLQWQPGYALP